MIKYLLDTCIISYYLEGDKNVIKHIHDKPITELAISVITIFEIEYGFELKSKKPLYDKWRFLSNELCVINIDKQIAVINAKIRAKLKLTGQTIELADTLIAATALEHNLICVTNNTKHFNRIDELTLLDWSISD